MIDEYKAAGVPARKVWAQSFSLDDVLYWISTSRPSAGKRCTSTTPTSPVDLPSAAELQVAMPTGRQDRRAADVGAAGPRGRQDRPLPVRQDAQAAGLDIITWTLERSGLLTDGGGFYYQTVSSGHRQPRRHAGGARRARARSGILGIFSDWPAHRDLLRELHGPEVARRLRAGQPTGAAPPGRRTLDARGPRPPEIEREGCSECDPAGEGSSTSRGQRLQRRHRRVSRALARRVRIDFRIVEDVVVHDAGGVITSQPVTVVGHFEREIPTLLSPIRSCMASGRQNAVDGRPMMIDAVDAEVSRRLVHVAARTNEVAWRRWPAGGAAASAGRTGTWTSVYTGRCERACPA